MKFLLVAIAVFFILTSCEQRQLRSTHYAYSAPQQLADGIPIESLHNVGMDSTPIVRLTKLILADSFPNVHSLLIAKDGHLVYENYFAGRDEKRGDKLGYIEHTIDDLHDCRSITKSVTSACFGIAIKQGLIKSVDEPIFQYFKDYEENFDEQKRKITIQHLLTMTSGLEWNEEVSYRDPRNTELQMDMSSDPIGFILGRTMIADPGTTWVYNGGNTELLAEIIRRVSGITLDKFAEKFLFTPLGIQRYEWLPLKDDMPAAASGLRLRSRDLLKFGMLYLNKGKWGDTQILNETWTSQSLQSLVERPSGKYNGGGYGLQFWTHIDTIDNRAIDIQDAKGNGGQRIFFCKSLDLLVVITAGNYNQWDIANNSEAALLKYIIPAIKLESAHAFGQ